MRWLITGTRNGRPDVEKLLNEMFQQLGPPMEFVVGDAKGVDRAARMWALRQGIVVKMFVANWDKFGPKAGPLRNQEMVDHCSPGDLCLAFPSEGSRGTADCFGRAQKKGLTGRWYGHG